MFLLSNERKYFKDKERWFKYNTSSDYLNGKSTPTGTPWYIVTVSVSILHNSMAVFQNLFTHAGLYLLWSYVFAQGEKQKKSPCLSLIFQNASVSDKMPVKKCNSTLAPE